MSLIVPAKYIKSLIEQNDKVARFLQLIASQSDKTADGYGIGLSYFDKFLKQLSSTKNRSYPKE